VLQLSMLGWAMLHWVLTLGGAVLSCPGSPVACVVVVVRSVCDVWHVMACKQALQAWAGRRLF